MNRTSKNSILLIFTFGFFATMVAVLWHMNIATHESRNNNIEVRRQIIEETDKNAREDLLRNNLTSSLLYKEQLMEHIVSRAEVLNFIKLVENLGTREGSDLTIDTINIGEPAEGAVLGHVDGKFRISVVGPWKSVTRTLIALEHIPYKLYLSSAHFEKLGFGEGISNRPSSGATSTMTWRADVELVVKTLP